MFYYYLCSGEYEDYYEIPLIHEKDYSEEEFIDLSKEVSSRFKGHFEIEDISKVLIDEYGFKEVHQKRAYFDEYERKWSD